MFPLTVTVPVTGVPFVVLTRMNVAVLSVEFLIASEKVADTAEFNGTAAAPLAGAVEITSGGVVSGAAAVVKFQAKLVPNALPAASLATVVIVTVY